MYTRLGRYITRVLAALLFVDRYPEMQLVEPYVAGKPFFPWPDQEEDEGGAQGATADRDD